MRIFEYTSLSTAFWAPLVQCLWAGTLANLTETARMSCGSHFRGPGAVRVCPSVPDCAQGSWESAQTMGIPLAGPAPCCPVHSAHGPMTFPRVSAETREGPDAPEARRGGRQAQPRLLGGIRKKYYETYQRALDGLRGSSRVLRQRDAQWKRVPTASARPRWSVHDGTIRPRGGSFTTPTMLPTLSDTSCALYGPILDPPPPPPAANRPPAETYWPM